MWMNYWRQLLVFDWVDVEMTRALWVGHLNCGCCEELGISFCRLIMLVFTLWILWECTCGWQNGLGMVIYLFILICEIKEPLGMCCFALGLNWLIQYSAKLESHLCLLFGENSILQGSVRQRLPVAALAACRPACSYSRHACLQQRLPSGGALQQRPLPGCLQLQSIRLP